MSNDKKLTIGLFGFGVVGEGIYNVLLQTPTLRAAITKICIKHPEKQRNAPAEFFTTDAKALLNDDSINLIVELIDEADAAFEIVKTALKNKKAVVSANKKMIAEHQAELLELQLQNNVPFLYEAAVGGSIPIIRNLEEYYDNDLLNSVSGIINGSTNFILTRINEDGLAYEFALKQAQELGFAESNPSLDVEGKDAANKLSIILHHAYGIICSPENIIHKGITRLHPSDALYAKEKGLNLKLVANAKRVNENEIATYVLPSFVNSKSQLFNIRNEFNGILIGSKLADEQFLYGKGAGRYPTSSAVLSDISALRYDYKYEYKKARTGIKYKLLNNYFLKIYVSYKSQEKFDISKFISIEEDHRSLKRNYIVGIINLRDLQKCEWYGNKDVSIVAFTEEVHEEQIILQSNGELCFA